MSEIMVQTIVGPLEKFIAWLAAFGEESYDHQSYFAGPIGGKAKALYYKAPLLGMLAVSPMILSEAIVPSARRLFWRPMRFPIADAHYTMGFAYLSQVLHKQDYYANAVHFLESLGKSRCPHYEHYCWGYPFNWVTRTGTFKEGTPFITTTPYVYEAFESVYRIDRQDRWLSIMRSIANHAMNDIADFATSDNASTCSYTPYDRGGVINASAYRAFLLTAASRQFIEERYWQVAERNLNFVFQSQQSDGSWLYAIDSARGFVDHFHTCFVLKALAKIELMTGHRGCQNAIEKGVKYYRANLFDKNGLPKPFSKAPRLTVYKNELYDYAECINLCILLRARYEELDKVLRIVLHDLLSHWQKSDGSFRSRKLYIGWDNVPMHRWAQSQIFRSLSLLLHNEGALEVPQTGIPSECSQYGPATTPDPLESR